MKNKFVKESEVFVYSTTSQPGCDHNVEGRLQNNFDTRREGLHPRSTTDGEIESHLLHKMDRALDRERYDHQNR